MRLASFTLIGQEGPRRLGAVDGEVVRDLSATRPDLPPDVGLLFALSPSLADLADLAVRSPGLALDGVRLGPPVPNPPTFLAVGLNYRAHVDEGAQEEPRHPVIFNKQVTCVTGPGDPIHIPRVAPDHVDYEGELGVVIGRDCRHVPAADAAQVIGGYLVVNDVSVRDWQRQTPTITMGKSFDTHGPTGPWVVTADAVDASDLRLRTWVNGDLRQDSRTSEMIFDVPALIAHLSAAFTLRAGTIIATGTPAGVGLYRQPPEMLRPGDRVEIEIDGIGRLANPVMAEPDGTGRW